MNLFQAIHHAALINTNDFYCSEMTKAIAKIQDILGQGDGDIAGVHFSDIEDKWLDMSHESRIDCLKDYVRVEIALFDGEAFAEQSKDAFTVNQLLDMYRTAKASDNLSPEETESAYVTAYEAISKVEGLGEFQEETDISSNDLLEALESGKLSNITGSWLLNHEQPK